MTSSRLLWVMTAAVMACTAAQPARAQSAAAEPACIALTTPSVQGVEGVATDFGVAVRNLFASFLTGPSIKSVVLEARLPSQAALEAREKKCGQLLLASVTRTRSGGSKLGGVLGQAAGIAAIRTPVGGGVGGTLASSATWAGGEAIYRFASETRARDELELSYRVGAPDAVERAKPVTSKAKARANGEDLLTPLVEKAATDIVAAASGARQ